MTDLAAIAAAANVSPEYATAYMQTIAATAAKLIAAGEMTIDEIDWQLVRDVADARIEKLMHDNADAILEEVWNRANAA